MSDIIKDTEEYSIAQLLDEVERRKETLEENESNALPKEYYPYEEMLGMPCDSSDYNYYSAYIDDGCEGFNYLVALKKNQSDEHWEDSDVQEENIRSSVKHHFVKFCHSINASAKHNDITVVKIGEYDLKFIFAEETLLSDEEEET